jgi:hypothetical protein
MKQTIFIFILLFISNISLAQGDLSPPDKWMFFYYQNPQPDKLIENVRAMSKRGQLSQTAGLIPAFLGRVFAQNPGRIDQWMTSLKDLPQNELYTLYNALWLSNTNEGRAVLTKVGLKMPDGAAPDMLTLEVNEDDPMLIDALWGYFMATGDTRVVRRVISGFNYSQYEGAEKRYKSSKQTEQDKREAYKAVIFEAAKASLIDNCLMHPVVLAYCEKIWKGKELNQTESLWLGVVLAKVAPEKYKIEIKK